MWGGRPPFSMPPQHAARRPEPPSKDEMTPTEARPLRRIRRAGGQLRQAVRRVQDHAPWRGGLRPTVSIIVPLYNVEQYIGECLDSIAAQDFADYEVVAVDDGSPDGSRAIAEEHAARDRRIRVLSRENGGLGAARNTGVRHARGRYLTFLDSDDTLPPDALATLVEAAESSDAEIAVGALRRFNSKREWLDEWTHRLHRDQRILNGIEEFLPLLRNLYTCDKLFRRDFWDEADLWFREGVAYEDQPLVTELYARARRIVVLDQPVYNYRAREDKSSISQQTAELRDLRDRIKAWRVSRDALRGRVSDAIYEGWLQTLFDAHFHWYLTSRGTVDDAYWAELRDAVVELTEDAPQELWDATPPDKRVLIELTRQDRRSDVLEFVRLDSRKLDLWPATCREDGILLHLPCLGEPGLEESLFVLRPEQMTLAHSVESFRWLAGSESSPATCELSGWAFIRKVDLAQHESHVSVVLQSSRTGEERVFPSTDNPAPAFAPPAGDNWCDYEPGTFRAQIAVGDVVAGSHPDERWSVLLRVTAAGFTVTQEVTRLVRSGSAGVIPACTLPSGDRVISEWRVNKALRLRVVPRAVEVTDVAIADRCLSGVIGGPGHEAVVAVMARAEGTTARTRVVHTGERREFSLDLPPLPQVATGRPVKWKIEAVTDDEAVLGLAYADRQPRVVATKTTTCVVQPNRNGNLFLSEWALGAVAETLAVTTDGVVTVTGSVFGSGAQTSGLVVRSKRSVALGTAVPVVDGRFNAEVRLTHEVYRFGQLPLPTGNHDFNLRIATDDGDSVEVPLRMSSMLNEALPVRIDSKHHEGRVVRGARGVLHAALVRPIGDARSRYHQQRLRRAAPRSRATTRGVLMQSYFGEQASDSGVSIQKELHRRGSDLPVYWAVQDYGVPVPTGGQPVVVNTPEWYDLLGSVTYYVDNMYQPEYHCKPEGQVIVETFHGYPFKRMGHPHWEAMQLSQARIAAYDRRASEWDFLVSPARYATPLLQEAFAYTGDVLEIGYPRNDVLLSPEAEEIRALTRASLGIAEGQVAVLYAPTFRDYLATSHDRADMADYLDIPTATRLLGEGMILLVRGHAFNARTRQRVGNLPGVVDVTDYPEVSDLLLAADAAVVDYSSLRFDFGVTGKPMIFNVPDLQRYKDERGWLFDFEPTAPGPLVSSTEEVVEQLLALDRVKERHAEDYAAFRASYLSLEDGHAGERFVDAVFAPNGDA